MQQITLVQQIKSNTQSISANLNSIQPKKIGFWRRQFQPEVTNSQVLYNLVFGIFLPTLCFIYDPIVFRRNSPYENILFGNYKPFAYTLCFVSILAMSVWLVWREKLGRLNAVFAGLFFAGGSVSLFVGIVLFPFSLIGLIVLIGVFGFTPLFTSVIYLRNAKRAFLAAKPFFKGRTLVYTFILSAFFSLIIPAFINVEINRSLNKMLTGDSQTIRNEAAKLKYIAPIIDFDKLVNHHIQSSDVQKETEEMQTLVEVYQDLTGEKLETGRIKF